ncbi:alpha-ribazole phosphatase [Rhodocytophaga rosea]|uniref:Alpha-ribazole phosphatase n=1 Tax=Rhodocytophaga rosea TaxID=2704465 RepID=A0A6C0GSG7_9BACT|nr:alpha-ribazole phosphatase [Rhodocytophaga rosea]QHT71071.1 alpha-ribazole phosphatase [Rhodocytophaga rosea]
MEIYLIRHTTPLIEKGICYGKSDIPLAESFEEEWKRIQEKLPESIDCIFSSPLSRCLLLAEKLQQSYHVPLLQDIRLMEMNFGEWELKAWNDMDQTSLNKWMNNYVSEICPGGESYSDLIYRVKEFIQELRKLSDKKILIITHGGVIKSFYTLLDIYTPEEAMKQPVVYGGIYQFML